MLKRLVLTVLAAAIAVGLGLAAQTGNADKTGNKIVIPVTKTQPTSGKQMFTSYCAPCHGIDGKGHGPAASALKEPPADLTVLSKANNGKYPDTRVVSVLQFGSTVPAHGSAEMPVWGPILGKMDVSNPQDRQLRITNLTQYLETIQTR
jgi:mono/diheme cytochrome c family protein